MSSDQPVFDIPQASRPLLSDISPQVAINLESSDQLTQASNIMCPICLEKYPKSEFIPLLPCTHKFCHHCLQSYLQERINRLKVLNITCPQEGCEAYLANGAIRQILDKNTYTAYENIVLNKLAVLQENRCFCPMPGCTRPYIISTQHPYTRCSCKSLICNTCGNRWHEGKTCLEVVDSEFRVYSDQHDIKFCPVCKTAISRAGEDCQKMICAVCDYQWCWDCGNQFNEHDQHYSSCQKLWNPNPPDRPKRSLIKVVKEKWAKKSAVEKFLIILGLIILSPIWLAILIVSWGTIIYFLEEGKQDWKSKPIKAVLIGLAYIILSIVTSPLALALILIYILIMPCIQIGVCLDKRKQARYQNSNAVPPKRNRKFKDPRWLTDDPQKFKYLSSE